jgi:hypothetical protein
MLPKIDRVAGSGRYPIMATWEMYLILDLIFYINLFLHSLAKAPLVELVS